MKSRGDFRSVPVMFGECWIDTQSVRASVIQRTDARGSSSRMVPASVALVAVGALAALAYWWAAVREALPPTPPPRSPRLPAPAEAIRRSIDRPIDR